MDNYQSILKNFQAENIPYLLIGTWTLKHQYPALMQGYEVKDCDIIIKNQLSTIRACIKMLLAQDWQVTLWQAPLGAEVSAQKLVGKFYFRAQKGSSVLDITYECSHLSWEQLYTARVKNSSFPVAHLEHILLLKKIKGTAKDWQIINRFQEALRA